VSTKEGKKLADLQNAAFVESSAAEDIGRDTENIVVMF